MTLLNMDLQHLRKPSILGLDVMKKYNGSEKQRLRKKVAGMNWTARSTYAYLLEKYLNKLRTQRGRMRRPEQLPEENIMDRQDLDLP